MSSPLRRLGLALAIVGAEGMDEEVLGREIAARMEPPPKPPKIDLEELFLRLPDPKGRDPIPPPPRFVPGSRRQRGGRRHRRSA